MPAPSPATMLQAALWPGPEQVPGAQGRALRFAAATPLQVSSRFLTAGAKTLNAEGARGKSRR